MDLSQYSVAHFDRGASRIKEAAWLAAKLIFFQNPLPWPSAVRVALLRAFGARVADNVTIRSGVNVTFPWRISIGRHVWIGEGSTLLSLAPITLGDHICISQQAYLCSGSHDFRSATFDLIVQPITIQSQVWLAAQTFIGPGVTVGRGSVVGAGAVVLRDVPPGSKVAPAAITVQPNRS